MINFKMKNLEILSKKILKSFLVCLNMLLLIIYMKTKVKINSQISKMIENTMMIC